MPNFVGTRRSGRHGTTHQPARAAAFALLPEYSPCARCHRMMWKWAKDKQGRSALHYDHNDTNTAYLGFSHRACNMHAGASKGGRVANARQRARRQSRATWGVPTPTAPTRTRVGGSAPSRW
jgi:hypothetical protein